MKKITLGISPCPNDTYIFGAMLQGKIEINYLLDYQLNDVQVLNKLAIKNELDVVKVSFGVFNEIKDNYKILRCGGALGYGCGPLLLSKKYSSTDDFKGKTVAIPGFNTTAFMVLKKFYPELAENAKELRFDKIMPALKNEEYDFGLVIHEGRFTFSNFNLHKVLDMGEVWQNWCNKPLPLGFIAINKRCLDIADDVNSMITRSLNYANNNRQGAFDFVKQYAQDLDDNVISSHIDLYVNNYSYDLTKASDAIRTLLNTDNSIFV